MNTNWDVSSLSIKIRLIRGAPKFPVVLYSPRRPVVKIEFIYICCIVSGTAAVRSPKRSSIVQTFNPFGISLFPDESVSLFELLFDPACVNSPVSVNWL